MKTRYSKYSSALAHCEVRTKPYHGPRKGRPCPTLDFEISEKIGCFLSFEWEKSNFTTFGHPLEKFRKSPLMPPPLENSDAYEPYAYFHKPAYITRHAVCKKTTA